MKKRIYAIALLAAVTALTSCGPDNGGDNKGKNDDPKPVTKCSHEFSFLNHKGLIDLEQCDKCNAKAYKFPIKYAAGYKDCDTLMDRTGAKSKSTWNIEGQLAEGKYQVQISAKLADETCLDRCWYNHAINDEETAEKNPDLATESEFRYWVTVDDKETFPSSINTFEEEGFDTESFNYCIFISNIEVKSTTKLVSLVHGDIGYGLYVEQIRFIAKDSSNIPDTLPPCPEDVFDPEGNTGGDTGGGGTTDPIDTSDVPDIGVTPGGEGEEVYGKRVYKTITVGASSQEAITLTSNNTGNEVSTLHDGIQDYVDAMYAAEAAEKLTDAQKYNMRDKACGNVSPVTYQGVYYEGGVAKDNKAGNIDYFGDSDRDNFKNVVLTYETSKADATSFYVEVGRKADLSDAKVVKTDKKTIQLSNLFVGETYYWRVTDANGKYHSAIGSFKTKGSFRTINAGAAYNVRDIGGKMTSSGKRMKQGCIYRGGELTPAKYDTGIAQKHIITLDKTGKSIFHDELNVRVELDFRNAGGESNNQTTSYIGEDVTFQRESVSSLSNFFNGNADQLKRIFTTFANATPEAAVYCHCWGGADRTGTAFFLLEGLLGVSYAEALMDYEFTSFDSIHTRRRDTKVTDFNGYSYDFPSLLSTIKKSSYYSSTSTFAQVCESWLKNKVKMTDAEIQNLKNNLLED